MNLPGIMKNILLVAFCALLVIGIAGCAKKPDERTAPQLAEDGRDYFEAGRYKDAIETYNRLKDWYPYSPHAREAGLKVADSHYHLGQYEEAIYAYEQYERLYPNDPEIPYVIYQIGLCHYERIRTVDRTQVPAKRALETFERLKVRFPASAYAEKAEPKIEECLEKIAGHEFYIGRFYFRSGHYSAAINRFENVVNRFPGHLDAYAEASEYLAKAKEKLAEEGDPPEAPEVDPDTYRRHPEDEDPFTSPDPSMPGPTPTPGPEPGPGL